MKRFIYIFVGALIVFILKSALTGGPADHVSKTVDQILTDAPVPSFPVRGPGQTVEKGITKWAVKLTGSGPGGAGELWLYLPEGKTKPASLPCVIIAPAGSHIIDGMGLGDGDTPEHLPYVRAGFAVLAYSVDGDLASDDPSIKDLAAGAKKFHDGAGGLVNFRNAINYLKASAPEVDMKRLYTAGHSSAATLALVMAEHEPLIKGCVAYAPVCDTIEFYGAFPLKRQIDRAAPETQPFMAEISPMANASRLKCPTMLFHADDDTQVTAGGATDRLASTLRSQGTKVQMTTVPTGGHFDSMMNPGIGLGIKFLTEECNAFPKPAPTAPAAGTRAGVTTRPAPAPRAIAR